MCRRGVTCSSGGLAKTCVVVFLLSAVGKLDASLLVTNGTHIIDYDISTNQQTVLPVSEPGGIVALAVDVGGQRLYYTNAETGGIVRCGLDGSNQHAVVNTDVTQPTGIAYDWVSGLVYWTDEGRGTVEVAQGDGSNRKTLISGQLFPRGIAVDPIAGYLFWGNQGDFTIRRARLDGSDVETLHNTGLVWPNELVVDFPNSRLYWIEGYFGYIGSSALDGTDRTIVANVSSGYVLFGLALQDDTLYYTSWEGKLFSVDQNSGEQSEIVMEGQGEQLLGLVSVHPSRQPAGSNQCQSDNGDCSHLCLPTGPDSRICTCPDDGGLAIGKDNKTCAEPGQFLLYAKADEGQIMMLTVDLSMAARPVLLDQGVRPVAVAYDPVEQRVYWSDVVTHTINRVFLNGTGSEVFMDSTNGIASVEGLAVDWQNRRLYFSNLGLHYTGVAWGRVEMVGLDRTGHRQLLEGRVGKPRSIVLDMQARHMYITDWGEEPKILRADLDGRDPQTIVSSEMENPNGLAISEGKLYWVDSHVKSGENSTGTLEQADLDGTNRAVLMQDVPLHIPFGLAVQDSTVYWTAWGQDGTGAVFQGNSRTGDHRVVVGGLGDPMAVTICNKSYTTPDEPYPCTGHECSHICVPTAGSYRCMCPNTGGLGLGIDGKSCIEPQQFLLVADLTEIRMVLLDTPDRYPYPIIQVHDLYSNIAAVTYDPETKTVYFSDVVHRDTGVSDGMTIDPVDRYLYWTDGERGTIERMALDGDEETHEVLLQGWIGPEQLCYMYWTDWGETPAVKRASMEVNATDVQNLVEGDLTWPNGLVVDGDEGKLYIGDGNNTRIEETLLDGSDRHLVLDESSGHVYGLAKVGDVLLWSDWAGQSVKMMTLGSDEIQVLVDGLMRPSELHVYPPSNVTVPNIPLTTEHMTTILQTTITVTTQGPPTTTKEPITTTEEPTTTTEPTTSPEPTTTTEPTTTQEPTTTTVPTTTPEPTTTTEPTTTPEPTTTTVPTTTPEPTTTTEPTTPEPTTTTEPTTTPEPTTTTEPTTTPEPTTTNEPTTTPEPTTTTVPTTTPEPTTTTEPTTTPEPTTTTEPTTTQEPTTTTEPTTTPEPTTTTEPTTTPEPTTTTQPTTTQEPTTTTQPTTPEPTTTTEPTTTPEPTTTTEPTTTPEPTTTTVPTTTPEPTKTTEPTTTPEPTTTTVPTTTPEPITTTPEPTTTTEPTTTPTPSCIDPTWVTKCSFSGQLKMMVVIRQSHAIPQFAVWLMKHASSQQMLPDVVSWHVDGQSMKLKSVPLSANKIVEIVTLTTVIEWKVNTAVYTTISTIQDLVESSSLVIPVNGTNYTADPTSFSIDFSNWGCPDGYIFYAGACYPCSEGTYYIGIDSECPSCPEGTYQDEVGQMTCKSCPSGMSTNGTGATSNATCQVIPEAEEATFDGHHVVFLAVGFICCITTVALVVVAVTRHCKKRQSKGEVWTRNDGDCHGGKDGVVLRRLLFFLRGEVTCPKKSEVLEQYTYCVSCGRSVGHKFKDHDGFAAKAKEKSQEKAKKCKFKDAAETVYQLIWGCAHKKVQKSPMGKAKLMLREATDTARAFDHEVSIPTDRQVY
ncbi:hypothetical protein Bbelb_034970 [Branchiostoma belcheri]|nr:hypothetical protein Bbelb_034970 [Branchiostoma belcheri]